MAPDAYFPLVFLTRLPWEKYDAVGLQPRNLAQMFRSKNWMTAPNIDFARLMATEILDWGKRRFPVFRQNGGQNYFRFEFRPQISTLRTRFPYMERIFRRLSASISEFKWLAISAFGLSAFAQQATIWRFLPSCWARNFATVSAMQTKLSTIVVLIW